MKMTSELAHELVVKAFKKADLSPSRVKNYKDEQPFSPYAGMTSVLKAFRGEDLSRYELARFQRFVDSGKEIPTAMSEEEIFRAVKSTLEAALPYPSIVGTKGNQNPFEGYVGSRTVYNTYKRRKITRETRNSFQRFYRDKKKNEVQ